MGNDVALAGATGDEVFSLVPRNLTEAMEYAKLIAASGVVPEAYVGKPGDCLVAIQMGAEVGLRPLAALQNIAVINGRPTMWGDAVLAVVRNSGLLEWIKERSPDDALAKGEGWCQVKRKGSPDPIERRFTLEDADRAGLISRSAGQKDGAQKGKGTWLTYPGRMLMWRARTWALRDEFDDVLKGLQIREEVVDMEHVGTKDGTDIYMPRSRSGSKAPPVEEGAVDAFIKENAATAPVRTNGGGHSRSDAPPKVNRENARVCKVVKVDTVNYTKDGERKSFFKIHFTEPDGGDGAASTFSETQRDLATNLAGKPAWIETTVGNKGYLNLVAIEAADPASAARPDVTYEPGSNG